MWSPQLYSICSDCRGFPFPASETQGQFSWGGSARRSKPSKNWSDESLQVGALPALLENFRRFIFCQIFFVPHQLTAPGSPRMAYNGLRGNARKPPKRCTVPTISRSAAIKGPARETVFRVTKWFVTIKPRTWLFDFPCFFVCTIKSYCREMLSHAEVTISKQDYKKKTLFYIKWSGELCSS